MEKLKIEYWPLEKLRPYERKLRKFDASTVRRMMESLTEYGFCLPVLAKSCGELVNGHLRLEAARRLGLDCAPVILADGLSDSQIKAFRLLVNRSAAWSSWDEDLVAIELAELRELDMDLNLTGFDVSELDALLALLPGEGGADPEEVPAVPETPVSRPGDMWILGNHRLLCGDATRPEDFQRLLGEDLAHLVVTDPPYNVDVEGKAGKIKNDAMSKEAFRNFLGTVFRELYVVLADGAAIYVAHSDTEGMSFRESFQSAGFKLASCLIWRKNVHVLGRADYQWQHEPILYGWKPSGRHGWFGGRRQSTLIEAIPGVVILEDGRAQVPVGDDVCIISGADLSVEVAPGSLVSVDKPLRSDDHPTMKPVALIERFVRNSSRPGEVVLDPFGGSGSTLIACERLGRICRTLELDPRFVDVIVARWEQFTGRQAVRREGGHE